MPLSNNRKTAPISYYLRSPSTLYLLLFLGGCEWFFPLNINNSRGNAPLVMLVASVTLVSVKSPINVGRMVQTLHK